MNSKIAVVTGATSFLGSALSECLVKKGYEVVAVVRANSQNAYRLEGINGIKTVLLDLAHISELHKYVPRADVFFHLGWDGSGSLGRQNAEIQARNFETSMQALVQASEIGCKTFVFAGSQAEYGKINGIYNEALPCSPISEYGKQKLKFGSLGYQKARELGIGFIHLRIFSVYGYNDRPNTLVESCIDAFEHGKSVELGKCTHLWNFLYVKDFAEIATEISGIDASLFKCENDSVFNVAGMETKVLREYVEDIHECANGNGSCKFGARAENAEGSPSIEPDISKLYGVIKYRPRYSFKEGIKEIMDKKYGKRCIVCQSRLGTTPLLSFDGMPASAQNIPTSEELAEEKAIKLELYQCSKCGLVQFDCDAVDYYKDVIRSGGFTTTMVELRRSQYTKLIEKYGLKGKKFLEVGCGQGEFLGVLSEFDVQAYGIENKSDLVQKARDKGLNVVKGFITDDEDPAKENGPYDAFLSFNFLEHQPDPNAMLERIYDNLTDDGVGLITVPSFEYIMEHDGYYEFIRDHIAYYTFETLEFLVNKNGFEVLEREMINRDTLSVVVKKKKFHDLSKIAKSFDNISGQFKELISKCAERGERVAIWGASHQGFTIASSLDLGEKIVYIIDSAPFKQNKYAPGSHIPIVSPQYFSENAVENVIIIAPGYSDEIAGVIRNKLKLDVNIYTLRSNHIERV